MKKLGIIGAIAGGIIGNCSKLKTQINTTDKDIDLMVYGLYGLTEKEIGIVENTTK